MIDKQAIRDLEQQAKGIEDLLNKETTYIFDRWHYLRVGDLNKRIKNLHKQAKQLKENK